jgi:hypothetical protein
MRRREFITLIGGSEAGGLMSYGTDIVEAFHQGGIYTGKILRAKSRPICQCCSRPNSSS